MLGIGARDSCSKFWSVTRASNIAIATGVGAFSLSQCNEQISVCDLCGARCVPSSAASIRDPIWLAAAAAREIDVVQDEKKKKKKKKKKDEQCLLLWLIGSVDHPILTVSGINRMQQTSESRELLLFDSEQEDDSSSSIIIINSR